MGSEAKFEVLYDGKPLASHTIDVHFGDERYSSKKLYAQVKTDAAGKFRFRLKAANESHVLDHLRSDGVSSP